MRTTTLVLIVSGVVLTAVALWLATILPIQCEVTNCNVDQFEITRTLHLNLWGTRVRELWVYLSPSENGKTQEVHQEGGSLGVRRHGPWINRVRYNDGEWVVSARWYIDGQMATEQEWNAYSRRR